MLRNHVGPVVWLTAMWSVSHVPAHAGLLFMRFAGGATEVTLGPSASATIEVLIHRDVFDKSKNRVSRIDARFDVGTLAPGIGGNYVQDGSTSLSVTGVAAPNYPDWDADGSIGVGGPFNNNFLLSVGDPNGVVGVPYWVDMEAPILLASFSIHLDTPSANDVFAVFRVTDSLPALHNGQGRWTNRFGPGTIIAGQQFELGPGNPGDADPRWEYHGYETLQPLIIHTVPEPYTLALVVLAGAACLRHRR